MATGLTAPRPRGPLCGYAPSREPNGAEGKEQRYVGMGVAGSVRARHPVRLSRAAQESGVHARRGPVAGAGIGANTVLFSVLNALVLKALPIADAARVYFVNNSGGPAQSFPNYRDIRDRNSVFESLFAYRIAMMSLDDDRARIARGATWSPATTSSRSPSNRRWAGSSRRPRTRIPTPALMPSSATHAGRAVSAGTRRSPGKTSASTATPIPYWESRRARSTAPKSSIGPRSGCP